MPSYTKAAVLILFASYHLAIAAPVPDDSNQVDNAFTGAAGNASGGNVHADNAPKSIFNGGSLLKLFSGNGGNGRHANSGTSSAVKPSTLQVGSNSTSDGSTSSGSTANSVGNAFSGTGGIAKGGDTAAAAGLLDLFSDNGGSGGDASSGSAGSPGLITKKLSPSGKSRIVRVVRKRLD